MCAKKKIADRMLLLHSGTPTTQGAISVTEMPRCSCTCVEIRTSAASFGLQSSNIQEVK
jgi:hypothetical protein